MRHHLSRGVLAATSTACVAAAAVGAQPGLAASPAAWQSLLADDPTGAVGLAASTLLWLLAGLIALGMAATALARLPGAAGRLADALSRRLLPAALRRAVHVAVGFSVGTAVLVPSGAWATAGGGSLPAARPAVAAAAPGVTLPSPYPALGEPAGSVPLSAPTSPPPQLAGTPGPTAGTASPVGRLPSDPALATALSGTAPPAASTSPPASPPAPPRATRGAAPPRAAPPAPAAVAAPPAPDAGIVVVPGDSLWLLAARSLAAEDAGAAQSAASIAAEWPRWWAANRAAIGADPDLLHPGERLRPPA